MSTDPLERHDSIGLYQPLPPTWRNTPAPCDIDLTRARAALAASSPAHIPPAHPASHIPSPATERGSSHMEEQ